MVVVMVVVIVVVVCVVAVVHKFHFCEPKCVHILL